MKAIFLALFVVAVAATPLPEDSGSDAVEMIVNGVPDGAALELRDIVDIKLKEHANGAVVATNLLHPYTAVGIAEAAAAIPVSNTVSVVDSGNLHPMPIVIPTIPIPELPEIVIPDPIVVVPEPIVLPAPVVPEPIVLPAPVVPEPIVMPAPVVPEPIVMPAPVVPEPIVMPAPVVPEVVEETEQLPVAAPHFNGEVYNDGLVQVQYNGPQEPSMLSTLQNWFNLVVNYFNSPSSAHAAPEPRH